MKTPYDSDPDMMALVLKGALSIVEKISDDVHVILQEHHTHYLFHGLNTVATALKWAGAQLDYQPSKSAKKTEDATQSPAHAAQLQARNRGARTF